MKYERKNLNTWKGTLKACATTTNKKPFFAGYFEGKEIIIFQDHKKGNWQIYAKS